MMKVRGNLKGDEYKLKMLNLKLHYLLQTKMSILNFNQQIVLDIDELSRTDIDEPIVLIKDYRDINGEDVIQVFIFTVQSKLSS